MENEMAWNKLPSNRPIVKLDAFDLEAENEGNAIRIGPRAIGPVGKKIAKIRRNHALGNAIAETRSTRDINIY